MYTMKQVCEASGLPYETLKFYCNEGLIPNLKRDRLNRRVFDDRAVGWIKSLKCLKDCGMGIREMRDYMYLCLEGKKSIPERMAMLQKKKADLKVQIQQVERSIEYIEEKEKFYQEVQRGKREILSGSSERKTGLYQQSPVGREPKTGIRKNRAELLSSDTGPSFSFATNGVQ